MFLLDYLQHRRDCQTKQSTRASTISSFPAPYHTPLTPTDKETLTAPIESLVASVHAGTTTPLSILHTYGKLALKAHARTNCLTEILLPSAEEWLATSDKDKNGGEINLRGPLAGIPVSLKDTVIVGGYDTTVGFSSFVGNKTPLDGPMVRMLKDAGAVPYVKTNLPITLLSFESTNEVWGRCVNPHKKGYSRAGVRGYLYYLWVKYVKRDDVWARLVRNWRAQSAFENWKLLDYSAGVLPITHVDKALDKLPASFEIKKLNGVARGAYKHYDAEKMHGLPVGVQVVGRRLEEEKVLAIMKRLEDGLGENKYQLMGFDDLD
ncbi:hypothetical protein N0V88_003863 [Collariella sp. IMI 366227]|nr:hypothetical protein N0V88_003863 [Collariella sp. IMI 366227]